MQRAKRICAVLSVLLSLVLAVPVFAADDAKAAEAFDDTSPSLTVQFVSDGTAVSGARISIYYIASVSVDGGAVHYTALTGDYEYEGITASESSEIAAALAEEVTEEAASGTTDEDGCVTFTDLERGLYLVISEDEITGEDGTQYSFSPYLIAVPLGDDSGEIITWIYEVESIPKAISTTTQEEAVQTGDRDLMPVFLCLAGSITAAALIILLRRKEDTV